jgi:hypothetical protein
LTTASTVVEEWLALGEVVGRVMGTPLRKQAFASNGRGTNALTSA